ncbi:hypothetical protein O6H91_03G049400 [Diphasiastrum complanatum]|uniref:Uncharacterized protein n=1 Tax=Diphasiastrum complanatum TaxID=34168 RepID=A0ACC2E668_DIPCM|nr:hypothetical protein O6H91_Y176500 [Diphasiastrum complanatum]KAJ7561954.1 hypothetical protein O6H91_03G049400 [Diphasiastrum complanatum]
MAYTEQRAGPQKAVVEYPLPGARQTHEIVAIDDVLVISQQDCSGLLKVPLDNMTGRPTAVKRFQMGNSKYSGFHGLFASKKHPGCVWGTLQLDSTILLIDPHAKDVNRPPEKISEYHLPSQVWGPHVVIEDGFDVWTTCKGSGHLVKINTRLPQKDDRAFTVYECHGRPIFVAVHPTSKEVYASLDLESKILRINPEKRVQSLIDIPPERGSSPVGLIAGDDGNVWFVLVGNKSGGTGTFGCISSTGNITWIKLPVLNANVGLIHLAFQPKINSGFIINNHEDNADMKNKEVIRLWLLGSTLASAQSLDAIFSVTLQGERVPRQDTIALPTQQSFTHRLRVVRQDTIALPTQQCFAHRLLPYRSGLFVTELGVSMLAHATGEGIRLGGDVNHILRQSYQIPSETSDAYALWGLGRYSDSLRYDSQDAPERMLPLSGQDQDQDQEDKALPLPKKR